MRIFLDCAQVQQARMPMALRKALLGSGSVLWASILLEVPNVRRVWQGNPPILLNPSEHPRAGVLSVTLACGLTRPPQI